MAPSFAKQDNRFSKFDDEHRIAYGWAIVSTENGSTPYFDLHGDHIPMDAVIAASVDFMKSSRVSDDMHEERKTGEVVYCAPVTKGTVVDPAHPNREGLWIGVQIHDETVYKATKGGDRRGFSIGGWLEEAEYIAGKRTKGAALAKADREHTEALRKGEKPQRIFRSFRLGFISTVDWPAQEGALISVVKSAGRPESLVWLRKAALYTTEVDGHQHLIDLSCFDENGTGYTSYNTSEGAEYGHSHAVTRAADGSLTILADSGHTHDLAPDQPAVVVVPQDTIVVVQARKNSDEKTGSAVASMQVSANKSTRSADVPHGSFNTEKSQMDKDKQIADLTAKNAELEKRNGALSRMSAVAFAVYKSLAGSDADAFLAKTNAEQDAAAADIAKRAEEADKVVYVSKSTGDVYRAKDDSRLVEMAKRLDGESEKREAVEIRKAAETLFAKKAPGTDETHDDIVRSIRKSGLPKERIEAMEASLKGLVETSTIGKKAPGFSGGTETGNDADPQVAFAELEKGLATFCAEQKITKNVWTDGLAAFVKTEKGAALKKAHDESLAG